MFPNLDEDVLLAVYLATNNNLPQAIDELLEFNDPNHKAISSLPENTNSQNPTSTPQSQIDLDEQLALMLQDQVSFFFLFSFFIISFHYNVLIYFFFFSYLWNNFKEMNNYVKIYLKVKFFFEQKIIIMRISF